MRSHVLTLAAAALLAGAGLLSAQTTPPAQPHQHPEPSSTAPDQPGMMGGQMMEDCKAMMAKQQAMHEQAAAMDAKLDSLVAAMNEARGSKKADATAAVVAELVAQRKAMREAMETMHPMMMEHMMKHMRMGMMQGMMGSMAGCPMMGERTPSEGSEHQH